MAYPVENPVTPIPALPDWVEAYYTPRPQRTGPRPRP